MLWQTRVMLNSVFWGPNAQIWKFAPRPPNFCKFWKIIKVLILPHQYASKEPSTTFQSICKLQLCLFSCFLPQMPKYENSAPDPRFLSFFENYQIFKIVLSIRFQRALNDFPILKQTQIMSIFVFCLFSKTALLILPR